ncbi:MAG: ubiquinol-cytochrome c reductase iron-sulfur subunit [Solirubrobacterales bacterium]
MSWSAKFARLVAVLGGLAGLFRRRRPAPRPWGEREQSTPEQIAEEVPPEQIDTTPHPGSELIVALLLFAAAIGFAGFAFFYVVNMDTQLLGLCIGIGLVLAGVAAALAGKRVVFDEKSTEEYEDFGDEETQREVENLALEGKIALSRRRLLFSALAAVGAALGAAAVLPIASLGPRVGEKVYETPWRAGKKVVDEKGEAITLETLDVGEFITAFPQDASLEDLGSPVILVRLDPDEIEMPADREHAAPRGYVAYSKICTHAGCAVSMLRYPTYAPNQPEPAIVCPCHYSTFNPADGGSVVFGPAGRPLPQLPLRVADDGSLEAAAGFYEPIGPSYGGIREEPGEKRS